MAEKHQVAARGTSGTTESSLLPPSAFFVPPRREAATSCHLLEVADGRRAAVQRHKDLEESVMTEQCTDDEETERPASPVGGASRKRSAQRARSKSRPEATVEVAPCCAAAVTVRHLEEMVLRQATEIVGLQTNLAEERRQLQSMKAASDLSSAAAEQRWASIVKQLESELSSTKATLHAELSALRAAYDRDIATKDIDLARATELLKSTTQQKDVQLQATLAQLDDARHQCDALAEQKVAEAREANKVLAARDTTIAQLKAYLGEQQSQAAEYSHWAAEKAALINKMQESQQAQDSISVTAELLGVRLRSLEEILAIHEKELASSSSSKDATVIAVQPSDVGNEKNLLTRWREKVYELLVQRKALEIAAKKDEAACKAKIAAVEHDVRTAKAHCEVMARQIQDKDAQLLLERQARLTAERLHEQALNRVSAAHHEKEVANRSSELLWKSLTQYQTWQADAEKTFLQGVDSMKTLSQRLQFAAGRVKLVEAYLVRKKKLKLAMQSEQQATTVNTVAPGQSSCGCFVVSGSGFSDGNNCKHLTCNDDSRTTTSAAAIAFASCCRSELEQVTKERDTLAARLQADACLFEQALVDLKRQHAAQVAELQTKIESFEELIRSKNERLSALTSVRSDLESELEHAKLRAAELARSVDTLSEDLRQAEGRAKQAADELWNERLVACQRQLTEVRAQLAKAEVSASRMERERVREHTQLREKLAEAQRVCVEVTERLEAKNKCLQAECNMLMTMIRQEGLLSKLKSARQRPCDATAVLASNDDYLDKQKNLDSADSALLGSVEKLTMELLGPPDQSPNVPDFVEEDESS